MEQGEYAPRVVDTFNTGGKAPTDVHEAAARGDDWPAGQGSQEAKLPPGDDVFGGHAEK